MLETLLSTKILPPPTRPDLVSRPRLVEQLIKGLDHKLILISAPAGFGKTTLVTEWLQTLHSIHNKKTQPQYKIAWLSLDEEDNDPARFFTYLITTLQNADPEIGKSVQTMMQLPQPPPPPVLLTSLINEIASISQPLVLIFDDYHVIQSLPIHQQLGFLVEHQPPQMCMVLVTREDPPLPLPQLRASGQMVEIRQEHLHFSLEECGQFLHQVMGLKLSASEIAALNQRTEGWIAGLQLVALSIKESTDFEVFVRDFSGSNRYILDYLMDEVFTQQPTEVQDFLMKTCILNRLSAPLCEVVSENSSSQDILLSLEQANLFLVPLDQSRTWYRYHQLFTDLLRHRLHDSGKYSVSHLNKRASQWYESNGFMSEAVYHALVAKDWERAGRVIEQVVPEAIQNGQLSTVNSWLDALPEACIRENLTHCTTKGWVSLLMGHIETSEIYAELAEGLLPDNQAPGSQIPLIALRSSLALAQQDVPAAIKLSQEPLRLIEQQENVFFHGIALNNLAQAYMMEGDLPAATKSYREIVRISQNTSPSPTTISAFAQLAALLNQGGNRREAVLICKKALQQCVDMQGNPLPLAGFIHIPLGILFYEENNLQLARQHLLKGMEYGEQLGVVTGVITTGGMALAQLEQAVGEADEALATIAGIIQLASQYDLGIVRSMAEGIRADIQMKQGNIQAAELWAKSAGLSLSDAPNPFREGELFTYTRLLSAQNKLDDAEAILEKFERFAQEGDRQRSLITVYILHALTQQAKGCLKESLILLEKAIQLAAPEGYRRVFLDEGQQVINLLPKVRHLSQEFVDQLLEDVLTEPDLRIPSVITQPLVEPLSERELEILQLVADGLSNREIAKRLILSVGTVKAHLHNIYGKMEVRGRTQAIAKARELELI